MRSNIYFTSVSAVTFLVLSSFISRSHARLRHPHQFYMHHKLNSYRDNELEHSPNVIPLPRKPSTMLYDRFLGSGIVPQLVKYPPKSIIKVDFPSGESVCLGNHLNFLDSLLEPTYNWNYKPGNLYTLMMIDPDAPLPETPFLSPFVHHLIINAPGPDRLREGRSVIHYSRPTVPLGSHFHRMVILVFQQKGRISEEGISQINFDLKHFIQRHKLGRPIAGNFFYSKLYVTRKVIC